MRSENNLIYFLFIKQEATADETVWKDCEAEKDDKTE